MLRHRIFTAAMLALMFTGKAHSQGAVAQPDSGRPVLPAPGTLIHSATPETRTPLAAADTMSPELHSDDPGLPGKSLLTAYGISLLGTVLPFVAGAAIPVDGTSGDAAAVVKSSLLLGGLLAGPSAGQIYAGSYGRAGVATAVRTAGFMTGIYGLSRTTLFCEDCSEDKYAGAWIVGGFVVYVGGIVYSLYDEGEAVEHYNSKLRDKDTFGWAPTWAPGPAGSTRTGAMAWMRF